MDNLEFLDGADAPSEVVQPEAVETPAAEPVAAEPAAVTETAEEKATRERDDKGRFKAKEADEPVMVPLKALHETRDELKALKAELDRIRQPAQQQAPQVPDMFEDPEGYQSHINQTVQQATLNVTLNISEELTRQQAGNETVDAASEWAKQAFQTNPALYQSFISQRNPYGFIVGEYQKQQMLSQLGGDPKELQAYLAWKQAQQAQPATQVAPTQPIERPTSSIASATSAGGVQHTAVGPGVAFDNVIK